MSGIVPRISDALQALQPAVLEIRDESERHAGHAGAGDGGHYRMTIVSDRFSGQNLMARHRMVYGMLSEMMKGEIHALAIKAFTPSEYQMKQTSPT
ncbi:MAG TPA: BolA family protein [Burkholderiales bacterium]|nr:BolA family protein [Burkholderiales bacterium]